MLVNADITLYIRRQAFRGAEVEQAIKRIQPSARGLVREHHEMLKTAFAQIIALAFAHRRRQRRFNDAAFHEDSGQHWYVIVDYGPLQGDA